MATDTIEPSMLEKAAGLDVLDASGKSTSFGSLFNDQKTIIVFIREARRCSLLMHDFMHITQGIFIAV
jgi:hypothetical protein